MNKSNLMKAAHKIAKQTVAIVGDYLIDLKLALKTVWGEAMKEEVIYHKMKDGEKLQDALNEIDKKAFKNGIRKQGVKAVIDYGCRNIVCSVSGANGWYEKCTKEHLGFIDGLTA